MGFRFRFPVVLIMFFISSILSGCVSYRYLKTVKGREVLSPGEMFEIGKTTLGEVLSMLGAPDRVMELEGKDLLVYEREFEKNGRLTLSVPVIEYLKVRFSAYGTELNHDFLCLFFTPDGILENMVFEKGSSIPFIKAVLEAKR